MPVITTDGSLPTTSLLGCAVPKPIPPQTMKLLAPSTTGPFAAAAGLLFGGALRVALGWAEPPHPARMKHSSTIAATNRIVPGCHIRHGPVARRRVRNPPGRAVTDA